MEVESLLDTLKPSKKRIFRPLPRPGVACDMLQALLRTATEILDSRKAAYSFIAALFASVLHLYFNVPIENALLLASPLALATAAQAHVDASAAKQPAAAAPAAPAAPPGLTTTTDTPAATPASTTTSTTP